MVKGRRILVLAVVLFASATMLLEGVSSEVPKISILVPEDGTVLTSPRATVSGNSTDGGVMQQVWDIEQLGTESARDVSVEGSVAVMRPRLLFHDDFDGPQIDMDAWTVKEPNLLYFNGGLLFLENYRTKFPSVSNTVSVVPTDRDFSAEVRMSMTITGNGTIMGGCSRGQRSIDDSPLAVATLDAFALPHFYSVYMDGAPVLNYTDAHLMTTYRVDRSVEDGLFTTYKGDTRLGSSTATFREGVFWFYANLYSDKQTALIKVDYAAVWARSGAWVSRPLAMAGYTLMEGVEALWSSTHPTKGIVGLDVRSSPDSKDWSEWTPVRNGKPASTVGGKFIQFRVKPALIGVSNTSANLTVHGLRLSIRHPLERVEVRVGDGEWSNASGTGRWTAGVSLAEDANVVEARAVDTAGCASVPASVRLLLDTTPPVGTVRIWGGGGLTNDPNVTLVLNATDAYGVRWVLVSHYPDMLDEVAFPFQQEVPWSIQGGQGENPVFVRFVDNNGWRSEIVSATVLFDSTPPSAKLLIDREAAYTPDLEVWLDLTCHDASGIDSIELSNKEGFDDGVTIPPGERVVERWRLLEGGDGPRTVYARITDLAGNAVVVVATVEFYSSKSAGTITIEGGIPLTAKRVVQLSMSCPPEMHAGQMQLSCDPAFVTAEWEAFATERLFHLPDGDGDVTVYVRFLDFRGIATLPVQDTIVLDTTPPTISVLLNGGIWYTTEGAVTVEVIYEDASAPGTMRVCEDGRPDLAMPRVFEDLFFWSVTSWAGDHTVLVRVTDAAGNVAEASAKVHYATVPPSVDVRFIEGSVVNASGELVVMVRWQDPYGGVEVQMGIDKDPGADAPWSGCDTPLRIAMPSAIAEGAHTVRLCARNAIGLTSEVRSWSFTIDNTPPRVRLLTPHEGVVIAQSELLLKVRFSVEDATGAARVAYRVDGDRWIWLENVTEREFKVWLADFGEHTVELMVLDAADNEGTAASTFGLERSMAPPVTLVAGAVLFVVAVAVGIVVVYRSNRRRGGAEGKAWDDGRGP